jgi:hypothetical protein
MKSIIAITAAFALLLGGVATADTQDVDVQWFSDGSPSGGTSYMTRLEDTVLLTLEATGLNPGDAITLWWVVFNNPAGCTGGVCGDDEFDDDTGAALAAAGAAVGNASGNVVKSDGSLEFGATLHQGMNDPEHQVIFNAYFDDNGSILTAEPSAAEIHLIVQSHGKGRGGKKLREQLAYFEANCTPACADVQFAVHLAPGP